MAKFKVGDKVRRKPGATRGNTWVRFETVAELISGTVTVTAVSPGGMYIQVDNYAYKEDVYPFHVNNFELVQSAPVEPVPTHPTHTGWDRAEAERLRRAAEKAVAEYNQYIVRQPEQMQPLTFKK